MADRPREPATAVALGTIPTVTTSTREVSRDTDASSPGTNARALVCFLAGLGSVFTFGAGGLGAIALWARIFFPIRGPGSSSRWASLTASAGVVLGGVGLAYAVYAIQSIGNCPGNPQLVADAGAWDFLFVTFTFLGPSLLGLMAAIADRFLPEGSLRWLPIAVLTLLSFAAALWAWFVFLFAVMSECFA